MDFLKIEIEMDANSATAVFSMFCLFIYFLLDILGVQ